VAELDASQRNVLLAQALNELEPGIGVQVRAERVDTGARFMLSVRAGGDLELVRKFRKTLLSGTQIQWRGSLVDAKLGSTMDVEKHREGKRSESNHRRSTQDEEETGKKLVIMNLQTDIVSDGLRTAALKELCEGYCYEGSQLLQFKVMQAKSGKSAFAWVCYETEEEMEAALAGNGLREDITDAGNLAWGTAYVTIKTPQTQGNVLALNEKKVWYAAPKELEQKVPTINVNSTTQSLQNLWENSLRDGSLAKAMGGLLSSEIKAVVGRVDGSLSELQAYRKHDNEKMSSLEKLMENAEAERRKDAKAARKIQERTNLLLERLMAGAGGTPLPAPKSRKQTKRSVESSDDEDEMDMGDSDEDEPKSVKKMKKKQVTGAEAGSHSVMLAKLLEGLGADKVMKSGALGLSESEAAKLMVELGLKKSK